MSIPRRRVRLPGERSRLRQIRRKKMRFICLGYADASVFNSMSKEEMESAMEECFAYDDVLRRGGHFVGGEALQEARTAVTLRYGAKGVDVTDGPYAETKE